MRCDVYSLEDISEEDLSELFPSKEAITVMSDPKLVPKWWGKGLDLPKDEAVLRSRPVASYGKQHKFGFSILHKEGCVFMLAPSSTGPRFFSPWEQAACLGLPSTIKLPGSLEIAWHVLGNAIGVAHALLQMSRLHVILGEGSPFSQTTAELPTLCRMMQRKGIHLSGKKQIWVEGCRIWSMQFPSRIETNLTDVVVPSQHVEVTMCEPESPSEPPSKVARFESEITPTAPFVVSDDVESCCKKGLNVEGLQFMAVPSDAEIEKMICDIVQSHVRDEYGVTVMPFAVSNLTARWVSHRLDQRGCNCVANYPCRLAIRSEQMVGKSAVQESRDRLS